ncbi:hypothetical protein [Polystyrenella longa]|uniref:hypothetical protein n=1 Tax=Polystyrenella longa TaxID=2528007 RepID=UPI0011AA08A3|nr:hypothetical protein [Polystyrenella longa]
MRCIASGCSAWLLGHVGPCLDLGGSPDRLLGVVLLCLLTTRLARRPFEPSLEPGIPFPFLPSCRLPIEIVSELATVPPQQSFALLVVASVHLTRNRFWFACPALWAGLV